MKAPRTWVTMSTLLALPAAALISAQAAKADPVSNYAALNAGPICSTIADYPTVAGVTGVLSGVMEESGFTAYQAGEVVAAAVIGWCPQYVPVLQRFVAVYSDGANNYVAGNKVGGAIR